MYCFCPPTWRQWRHMKMSYSWLSLQPKRNWEREDPSLLLKNHSRIICHVRDSLRDTRLGGAWLRDENGKEIWKGYSDSEPSPLERKLAETRTYKKGALADSFDNKPRVCLLLLYIGRSQTFEHFKEYRFQFTTPVPTHTFLISPCLSTLRTGRCYRSKVDTFWWHDWQKGKRWFNSWFCFLIK